MRAILSVKYFEKELHNVSNEECPRSAFNFCLCRIIVFTDFHIILILIPCNCTIYHGLPVSKHHGILPWFPGFKRTSYITSFIFTYIYLCMSKPILILFIYKHNFKHDVHAPFKFVIFYVIIFCLFYCANRIIQLL